MSTRAHAAGGAQRGLLACSCRSLQESCRPQATPTRKVHDRLPTPVRNQAQRHAAEMQAGQLGCESTQQQRCPYPAELASQPPGSCPPHTTPATAAHPVRAKMARSVHTLSGSRMRISTARPRLHQNCRAKPGVTRCAATRSAARLPVRHRRGVVQRSCWGYASPSTTCGQQMLKMQDRCALPATDGPASALAEPWLSWFSSGSAARRLLNSRTAQCGSDCLVASQAWEAPAAR